MSAPLRIGDKVVCRYYNTPDQRFYGETFTAVIVDDRRHLYNHNPPRDFAVKRDWADGTTTTITLDRREILRRIKS